MAFCINTNSEEYQTLKLRSGTPETILKAYCSEYLSKYGRMPYLDEIPKSNSKNYLVDKLDINDDGVLLSKLLELTATDTPEDAVIKLNQTYKDVEVEVAPIVSKGIIKITNRPTTAYKEITKRFLPDTRVSNPLVFGNIISKLGRLYGIEFVDVSDTELASDQWKDLMPENRVVNAFIKDGKIYINVDRASVDAPVHELLHLFLGAIKFNDRMLYSNLINTIEQAANYSQLLKLLENKTRSDANEEIFVTELAKYLTGRQSVFDTVSDTTKYNLEYNMLRLLDSILMGSYSVKAFGTLAVLNMSLKELASKVNSDIMTSQDVLNLSERHRKMSNIKSELMKKGELKEECN